GSPANLAWVVFGASKMRSSEGFGHFVFARHSAVISSFIGTVLRRCSLNASSTARVTSRAACWNRQTPKHVLPQPHPFGGFGCGCGPHHHSSAQPEEVPKGGLGGDAFP